MAAAMITEKQKELKKAFGVSRPICPECGRGDFTNTYESEHRHKLDCRVAKYMAQKALWDRFGKS